MNKISEIINYINNKSTDNNIIWIEFIPNIHIKMKDSKYRESLEEDFFNYYLTDKMDINEFIEYLETFKIAFEENGFKKDIYFLSKFTKDYIQKLNKIYLK